MNKEEIQKYLECGIAEFAECEKCRVKPGSPTLCQSCVQNRETISVCKEVIGQFVQKYQAAIDASVIVDTGDSETDGRFVNPVTFTQAMGVLPATWLIPLDNKKPKP